VSPADVPGRIRGIAKQSIRTCEIFSRLYPLLINILQKLKKRTFNFFLPGAGFALPCAKTNNLLVRIFSKTIRPMGVSWHTEAREDRREPGLQLRRWSGIALVILFLLTAMAPARDVEQDLRDFMRLVVKSPTSFGFQDAAEAEQARLGRAYALYGIREWTEYVQKAQGKVTADPDQAPNKIYEVLNKDGEPRCVFAYSRQADGAGYKPVSLGQPYVAPILRQLQDKTDVTELVLLLDLSTRTFHYANTRNPEVVHDFTK